MPKIKVNDINMYYEVYGEGFPLVMIHGMCANVDLWDPRLINELSKKFKTIVFDNRGTGRTDQPEIEYSIKMFANDTVGLMDALKIQKAHIFGTSMGGMIAQEFVINYTEKVEKLILCATVCGGSRTIAPSPKVLEILFFSENNPFLDKENIPLLFTEEFVKNNPYIIDQTLQQYLKAPTLAHAYKRQAEAAVKFDAGRRIKKINLPTLIIHGKKDFLVPPQNAEILAKRIPEAKLIFFEDSGHDLALQNWKKFAKTAIKFLES